eukprot:m.95045 g.95045  ORF g.95045 m.95045 type:complete len:87 (+) comp36834_c0_seq22:380-640(+)
MSMAPLQGSAMTPRDKSMERERRVAAAAAAAEAKYAAEPDARQIHRASIKGKLLTDSRSGTCLPGEDIRTHYCTVDYFSSSVSALP